VIRQFDLRPRGLPGPLPKGERLLWQGAPRWRALAVRALHVRKFAVYFAVLLAWYAASSLSGGAAPAAVALATAKLAGLALVPLALLTAYAWGIARTTVYSVTNRRVVVRFGIALPMTINLPFAQIDGAALKEAADGTGDIALTLARGARVSYLVAWPHVRPWRVGRAQPSLRSVPNVAQVAQVVSRALAAAAAVPVQPAPLARPQAAVSGVRAAAAA
jgi:hypothetical protein